jgi:hypothetical protein
MAKRTGDIEGDIDSLFQLPLTEFTAARNALSAKLKKEGRGEEAERIKALQKPSASAWAVNQLFWRRRSAVDALLQVGERFRKAQAAQLAGKSADMRSLLNERRDALSTLMRQAEDILGEAGHNASPDLTRRIMTTLEALATYGDTPGAPRAGRLTDDLDPPGFEALAALVPRGSGGKHASEPTRVLPFTQETRRKRGKDKAAEDEAARRAKAREALQTAEQNLREAQRDAERAEAELKKAAARAKAAQKEKDEIDKRYEKIQAEWQEATKEARKVAETAEEAAQAVTDAERELERARAAVEALD